MDEQLQKDFERTVFDFMAELAQTAGDAFTNLVKGGEYGDSLAHVVLSGVTWREDGPVSVELCLIPKIGAWEQRNA